MDPHADIEVSVLILTYNQEKSIARAVDSVLAQRTGFRYEIVLADDCSTDHTGEICREYARRYPDVVRLVERRHNVGVVESYFECVEAARGRYIADCAGDDYWLGTETLQQRRDILAANPALSLVHADWIEVDASGRPIAGRPEAGARYGAVTPGRVVLERLLAHDKAGAVHLSTALYRGDIVRRALGSDRQSVCNPSWGCEDLPVMALLLAEGAAGYIHRPVLAYTVGSASVSNPATLRRAARYYEQTALCTAVLTARYGVDRAVITPFMRRRVDVLTSIAFKLGDRTLAARAVVGGWRGGLTSMVHRAIMKVGPLWRLMIKKDVSDPEVGHIR